MVGITYTNTQTNIPGVTNDLHVRHPLGYAYETSSHFVHLYGVDRVFYTVSVGMTVIEKRHRDLTEWATTVFGATDIKPLKFEVGHSVEGVWRPSLLYFDDIYQALNCTEIDRQSSEQALRSLLGKLDELLLYIEPDPRSFNTFSHKTRELLILACTEVENSWKYYMDKAQVSPVQGKNYTTRDYVKLASKLHLSDYRFVLRSYENLPPIRPFEKWDESKPTKSLTWYDAYNKTKHDRSKHFQEATFWNCIHAVMANLVMHAVKFSPFSMTAGDNAFSSLFNQHFYGEFASCDPTTFYLHEFSFPSNTRGDLFFLNPRTNGYAKPFTTLPFILP